MKEHTSEEIKYRLSDLGVQIGNIAIEYITDLERKLEQTEKDLADYQFNYPKIKELEEENNKLLDVINGQDVKIADLEKENAELKAKLNFSTQYYLGEKAKDQLTKATEIIKSLIALHYNPVVTKDDLKKQDKILEQARQFIKEIEK